MAVWLYSQKILAIQPDFCGYIATNSGLYSQDPYNLKIAYWTSDMEFVKNFTHPDFQAKNFTPQKRVNCDIFLANQQRKCIKY